MNLIQFFCGDEAEPIDLLKQILKGVKTMSADLTKLKADFDSYKGDVSTALDALKASVQEQKDQLAALNDKLAQGDAVTQADIDAFDKSVTDADEALKAVPQAPSTPSA